MFQLTKFEKVKGSNIVKCALRNILLIIDKIVSLARNFPKVLAIMTWFLLFFLLLLLLIVYISLAFHREFFKVSFASLLYKYMKIWYFHGQYIRNGLGTNEISYNIFDYVTWTN